MVTDVAPINQVPNSYRFALNMCAESREGDYSALVNEEGNTECFQIEDNEKIIGTILISNGDTVIFIADEDQTYSKISIVDKNCNLTNRITSSCLNFNKAYPIHGTFKIHNGCNRIIYFTDNYNPIRSINLDGLGQYTPQIGTSEEDWINDANLNDSWLCELFKLNGDSIVPNINFLSIDDYGGVLPVGSYQFAIRYVTEDLNPTNWFYITNPVNLGETPKGDSGFHLLNSNGGVVGTDPDAPSGRTINLEITNLDTRYKYYQLASIEHREGTGQVTDVFELPRQLIESTSDIFVFKGTEETIEVTLESVSVPSLTFNKVGSIAQTDNRLILANTEDVLKDYTELQKIASKIKTSWGVNYMKKMHIGNYDLDSFQTDSSTGKFSFDYLTYARDEVYALGIVFVFNDGSESPVFHIPGRPANTGVINNNVYSNAAISIIGNANTHTRNQVPFGEPWDRQLLTVIDSSLVPNGTTEVRESNVKHIPLVEFTNPSDPRIGNTIERWKVFNTATHGPAGTINRYSGASSGCLGFYEADEIYKDILDCNGDSIWGVDFNGDSLVGEKIRHHRMPDSILYPIDDDLEIDNYVALAEMFPIKLNISNVDIPVNLLNDIQGFYIVKGVRSDSNATVLDAGLFVGTQYLPAYTNTETGESFPATSQVYSYITNIAGPYLNSELNIGVFISPRAQFRKDIKPSTYFKFDERLTANLITDLSQKEIRDVTEEDCQFRIITDYDYVNHDSIQGALGTFPYALQNLNSNIDTLFIRIEDPYNTLYITPADEFVQHYYVTLKQWIKPYGELGDIEYERTNNIKIEPVNSSTIFRIGGGDTYLGEMSFRTIGTGGERVNSNFYFESIVNPELRKSGEEDSENHWRNYGGTATDFVNTGGLEFFVENRDMSLRNDVRLYFPLPIDYDFCSECQNRFPTRIWYSKRSYQESIYDNYRVFLANDYRDLLSNGGEITNLFVYKDQLYAQTPETSWFVATRPQELQTNEGTISVGTGDLLSIPPRKLETVDRGYAGNQHKFSAVISEFGTTWVDADAGKVFNFNGQLNELSALGMRNWFAENLKFSGGVNDQISGFNIESTVHKNGIGFISTFDPRHNRYILRKKYYKIIDLEWLGSLIITDEYEADIENGYNSTTGEFYTWPIGFSLTIVNIHEDPTLVEDLSWTISFSYPHNAWMSYHSYRPNWMWHDRNNYYTYNNVTEGSNNRYAWLHNQRNYGEYYNLVHPSTIYGIFNVNGYLTKVFNHLELVTSSYSWLGDQLVKNEDDSIYEAFFHTDRQSSSLLSVQVKNSLDTTDPFVSIEYDLSKAEIQNNEDTWNLSKFYDLTFDYTLPIFTNDWSNSTYQNKRITDGYIYYPNDLRDDATKFQFDLNPLRGKYLGVFLNYDNTLANKFVIDFLNTSQNISFK
jgi:hypothetical protein